MICVLFCLPFRHLFREAFAMLVFSFAASMCMKYAFASFRGSSWKESPELPSVHILKLLFLNSSSSCFPALSRLGPQPRAPDLNGHCRTSSASARFPSPTASSRQESQWAMPDPNCDRQISVGTADNASARS